jgi:hypothetical protein
MSEHPLVRARARQRRRRRIGWSIAGAVAVIALVTGAVLWWQADARAASSRWELHHDSAVRALEGYDDDVARYDEMAQVAAQTIARSDELRRVGGDLFDASALARVSDAVNALREEIAFHDGFDPALEVVLDEPRTWAGAEALESTAEVLDDSGLNVLLHTSRMSTPRMSVLDAWRQIADAAPERAAELGLSDQARAAASAVAALEAPLDPANDAVWRAYVSAAGA